MQAHVADSVREACEAGFSELRKRQAQLHEDLRALTIAVREQGKAMKQLLRQGAAELDAVPARARQEFLDSFPQPPQAEDYEAVVKHGEELRAAWTRDGTLIAGTELAKRWGRTRQALDQACGRHELFNLKVGRRLWYPAVFLRHAADDVRAVCRALGEGDAASMLVFWMRRHGGLGGKTVSEAIEEKRLGRVLELARAWAEEHGWAHAQAA